MPQEPSDIKAKLKKADPQVKIYIAELEKENARLQLQIAKYDVKQMSLDNRIKALEKEIKENKPELHLNIAFADGKNPPVPAQEYEANLVRQVKGLGYRVEKITS